MSPSALHMLAFSLRNPYSLSFDRDGPFPVLYRLLRTKCTPTEEIDVTGFENKTILITGVTSGCGLRCAKAFARVACHLIVTARNREKGEDAVRQIIDSLEPSPCAAKVDLLELEMASERSISAFKYKLSKYASLDVAILNAGVYQPEFTICPETGQEETIQVNFLSNCAIALLAIPSLLRSHDQGRLLLISSEAYAWANPKQHTFSMLLKQLGDPDAYTSYERYHISKLLVVLWVQQLATRLDQNELLVACASPGFSRSSLFRSFNSSKIAQFLEDMVCRSPDEGASQYIMAAKGLDDHTNGAFFSDGRFRELATAAISEAATGLCDSVWDGVLGILPVCVQAVAQDLLIPFSTQ
ncbi:NAD(P)-binding protein [Aspergillus alliaceus]|uniref:NAD(P)-binding protein n=1 Tax=Petromyces alliaceus TaxID=209559 RepID=UPI0012A5A6FB|nr:NAD(P)-binding protein [Aspergillus alliaceus]KAB8233907.1 NAD(P)-binding protein [Aspergillus alliaceus]